MKISRRRLCTGVALAALAVPLMVSIPAQASQTEAPVDSGPAQSSVPPDAAAEDSLADTTPQVLVVPPIPLAPSAEEYWTPERMKSAIAVDAIEISDEELEEVLESGEQLVSSGLGSASGLDSALTTNPLLTAAYQHAPIKHIGKVFFSKNGANYVCSGASIQARHGNLVSTAGHCIHSDGSFVSNFTFVPAYSNGNAPYGHWSAAAYSTTSQWANSRAFAYDVGFVRVHNLNGKTLTDTVGARPAAWSTANNSATSAYGYPAGAPFNGQNLIACHANRTAHQSGIIRVGNCAFNGGASGGPWYTGGNSNGSQVSVNSFITGDGAIYGPYFGAGIKPVYAQAAGYDSDNGGSNPGDGSNPNIDTSKWYRIKNVNSAKCVDGYEWGTGNGTPLQQWDCNPNHQWNQDWMFTHVGGGYYTIKHRNSANRVWSIDRASTANGARIHMWDLAGQSTPKHWKPERQADGSYIFKVKSSGKCLDVPASSTANGARLQQWTCNNSNAQKFQLYVAP